MPLIQNQCSKNGIFTQITGQKQRQITEKEKHNKHTHTVDAPEIMITTLPRHTLSLTLVYGHKLLKKLLTTI